jgi:hypothetical protein
MCTCSFLSFERHSRAQCPILPQRRHSSPVGLLDDPLDEESSRSGPRPRPLLAPPPLAPLSEWFSTSRFFLHVFYSSSMRYNFPSWCNDIGVFSNASSASFNHPVRSVTDIVDTLNNVLITIVIFLKRCGKDQSIFTMILLSFTSSSRVVKYATMPLRRSA